MINNVSPVLTKRVSAINFLKMSRVHNSVSFGSVPDTFDSRARSVFGLIPEYELDEMMKIVDSTEKIGAGYKSNIFRYGNKIIKGSKETATDETARDFVTGQNLKEFVALKQIEQINPQIAPRAYDVVDRKGLFYLIEDFIEGAHPQKQNFTQAHIKTLLSNFLQLDRNGITNCDINDCNIFLMPEGKVRLIDFGSFNFLNNDGRVLSSDFIPASFFNRDGAFTSYTNLPIERKFARSFFYEIPKYYDIKNHVDNPHLNITSNLSNFELRTFFRYLRDGREENPIEFFREYLKSRGELYHAQMEEFLRSLDIKSAAVPDESLEVVETAQRKLLRAIDFEETAKQVFSNPSDNILKIELAKMQVKAFLNFGDDLGSKVTNSKKIGTAYNQLIALLEGNIASTDGIEKRYCEETLACLKHRFKDFEFDPEQLPIPEDEDIIKRVFKEVVKKTDEAPDVVNTVGNTLRRTNRSLYLLALPVLALVSFGGAFLYKKNKARKAQIKEVQSNSQPQAYPQTQVQTQQKTTVTLPPKTTTQTQIQPIIQPQKTLGTQLLDTAKPTVFAEFA